MSLVYAAIGGSPISINQVAAVLVVIAAVAVVAILSDTSSEDIPPRGLTIVLSVISGIGFATTFKLGQLAAETSGEWQSTFATRIAATVALGIVLLLLRPDLKVGRRALLPLFTMGILDGIALLAVISAATLEQPEFAAVAASMFGAFHHSARPYLSGRADGFEAMGRMYRCLPRHRLPYPLGTHGSRQSSRQHAGVHAHEWRCASGSPP